MEKGLLYLVTLVTKLLYVVLFHGDMIMLEPKSSDKVDGERNPLSLHKKTVGLYVV